MRTIWKYNFEITDVLAIEMPRGAEIIHIDTQSDVPSLWALVDPEAGKEGRRFRIFGTGHPIDSSTLSYLGTFQTNGGQLVFHVFE